MRVDNSLKWKDIELYVVKHPEDLTCHVLLVRVAHRLNKGKGNKGVPKACFHLYGMEQQPGSLCRPGHPLSIIHSPMSPRYLDPHQGTGTPAQHPFTPIHIKESAKGIPIFRRAMKSNEGSWITDPRRALTYDTALEYKKSTNASAGFKENRNPTQIPERGC
ncbi:uncharacterized protein N7473_013204 [Penicillium subrubescens]|uniref:uncharacterized protein n=1 Tax=Penicillium subrubescens TaxID=1316194 RepID=UPI002545B513|nr:uncharacterized protein N7473_013204 [Penicillium subrubescens]KAJ5873645.1 hypothetical protein N7473_013204 [Penicillium subrubescens]